MGRLQRITDSSAMHDLLQTHSRILIEAAIVERLRRSTDVQLHPTLANATLVYAEPGRAALRAIYQEYIDIARAAATPLLLCTPTWRANRVRVAEANVDPTINGHAATFMHDLRDAQGDFADRIRIGGLLGCKNDCYLPEQGLGADEATDFHAWQVEQLVAGGVDFLVAVTLPSVDEALGMARAMAASGLPYLVSFVIGRYGRVLDGTPLIDAVRRIDADTPTRPLGYMVNCAHPSFLDPARQPRELFDRLLGYQANASALDHCDLDGSDALHADDLAEWGELMLALNTRHGVKILGGCCGTTGEHLRYLVARH